MHFPVANNALEEFLCPAGIFGARTVEKKSMTNQTNQSNMTNKTSKTNMTKPLMNTELALERLLQLSVAGDRLATRTFIEQVHGHGLTATQLAHELYWPTMQTIFRMWRHDQLTTLAYQYATRLLRMLVDQAQARYEQAPRNGRTLLCVCGPNESEDLAGQLCSDLLEASGYCVFFAAGGVANDEIISEIGQRKPDALVVFAAAASDAPRIRQLIDMLREAQSRPSFPVICGGGVFARAPGLAEEIGADATADDPLAVERMVRCALAAPVATPTPAATATQRRSASNASPRTRIAVA